MGHGRPLRASLALAVTAVIGVAAAQAAAPEVTGDGVGDVQLGAKASALKQAGLVGRLRPGCELAPNTRSAKLRPPLKGVVNFSAGSPRRAESVLVTGGATAAGVGIGSSKHAVKQAFPHVKFDHRTEDVFGITLAKVPKADGGKFQIGVDSASKKVTSFGVPFIAFCE